MATELETFLSSIRGATSDLSQVNERIAKLNQEEKLKQFYQQAPELIERGEMGPLIAQAGEVDPVFGRELIRSQIQGASKNTMSDSLPAALLSKTYGLTPEIAAQLETLPRAEQLKLSKDFQTSRNQSRAAQIEEREAERRQTAASSQAADRTIKFVDQRTRKLRDKRLAVESISEIASSGDEAALDRILKSQAAKALGGDAGNLAVQEVRELVPLTMFESVAKLKNFINNTSVSQMPPQVKQGLIDVFDRTLKKTRALESQEAAKALGQYVKSSDFIGFDDPFVQDIVEQYDLRVERTKDGKVTVKPRGEENDNAQGTVQGSLRQGGAQETEVTKFVAQIQDPKAKAQAEAALSAYAGREIPQALVERIKQAAGAQ